MSKCQINKYKAGGRSCGSGSGGSRPAPQGDLPLAALLAARDAQDAAWTRPAPLAAPAAPGGQLALIQQKPKAPEKKMDIDTILSGDNDF